VYLLGKATTIEWEILATVSPPTLEDLGIVIIDPNGYMSHTAASVAAENYTPPTDVANGTLTYVITPGLLGYWRIHLVLNNGNNSN